MSEESTTQAVQSMPPNPPSSIDESFNTTLITTSRALAGSDADNLVTPAYGDALTDLITSLITSCLGGLNPGTAQSPATVASQMANMSSLQRSMLRTRAKRHMVKSGLSHQHGLLAASTIITVGKTVPQDQLTTAIAHVKDVDATFPQVDMF